MYLSTNRVENPCVWCRNRTLFSPARCVLTSGNMDSPVQESRLFVCEVMSAENRLARHYFQTHYRFCASAFNQRHINSKLREKNAKSTPTMCANSILLSLPERIHYPPCWPSLPLTGLKALGPSRSRRGRVFQQFSNFHRSAWLHFQRYSLETWQNNRSESKEAVYKGTDRSTCAPRRYEMNEKTALVRTERIIFIGRSFLWIFINIWPT